MDEDSFIPVAANGRSRSDLVERWIRYPMQPGLFQRTNTTMGAKGIVP